MALIDVLMPVLLELLKVLVPPLADLLAAFIRNYTDEMTATETQAQVASIVTQVVASFDVAPNMTGDEKRIYARQAIVNTLNDLNIPVPSLAVLDTLIELGLAKVRRDSLERPS